MATELLPAPDDGTTAIAGREQILRSERREISLLVATEGLSLTYAGRPAGERVADPHVHRHTEAFYVLEGELAFEVGAEREAVTVGAGGFVAVPPGLAHSYRTAGDGPARWLVVHAPDGGFAAFMRAARDGGAVDWDLGPVPAGGGRPAAHAVVRPPSVSRP